MKNLYVGNLPFQTTKEELRTLFESYGTVERVTMPRDIATGEARGFAFVEMQDENAAAEAIRALNGSKVGGRTLLVNKARPRAARAEGSPSALVVNSTSGSIALPRQRSVIHEPPSREE